MAQEKNQLVDTHCHIHDSEFEFLAGDVHARALESGVSKMICVGTSVKSSHEAITFCADNQGCFYSLALHPHIAGELTRAKLEAAWRSLESLAKKVAGDSRFVAIGECGLDHYYDKDKETLKKQEWLLEKHLELAEELHKPVIFHVREAFKSFWPVYDRYRPAGVIHSFSGGLGDAGGILERPKLYIGLNGIMTFTKDENQRAAAKAVPLERLLLETDAPYLTPTPIRGTINEPKNVSLVAEFLSDLRRESKDLLIDQTTANAHTLFGI